MERQVFEMQEREVGGGSEGEGGKERSERERGERLRKRSEEVMREALKEI